MNIRTKYNLKTEVYPIRKGGSSKFVNCELCKGRGVLSIVDNEKKITCPDCYGRRGSSEWIYDKWVVEIESISKVGRVNAEIGKERKITYMIEATGIGSGTLWNEDSLFLSMEDAKKECSKRNKNNLEGKQPTNRTEG